MRVLRVAHHAVVSAWRERERELRVQGADIELISSRRWNEGGRPVELDARGDTFVTPVATVGRHPSIFVFDPRPVWRALGRRPDLIDLHEEPNALVTAEILLLRRLRRCRAPYLLYSAQNIRKRYPVPFRWIERIALRGAAAAYVCNTDAAQILAGKGLRAPAAYIPLGVDTTAFTPRDRDTPAGRIVVGYVGRLEAHKGVDVLLRAAAAHDDWEVRITGDGPQRAALIALAARLGMAGRVRMLGFADGAALAAQYRELDVLAIPSRPTPGWKEQFCRVAVEAMASGVVVVASASGAIPDVVADAGVLVPPDDPEALSAGITRAVQPGRWSALRAAGLQRVARFTWKSVAATQLRLYRDVLGASASGRCEDPEVLVVAYGPPDMLDQCLAGLGDALPVTVVDNSSLPQTRDVAVRHRARYVDAGRNRGFAGGVNLGLNALRAAGRGDRDVLLLNPDARVDAAGVRVMHRVLYRHPRTAAVGARQVDPVNGAPVRVWWPFPTPAGAWIEAAGLGGLHRRHDFAIGSVLLLRAEALAQLGPLDERFFLYAEETDWQWRARRHGWDIRVADVRASHEGGGTGGDPTVRELHFYSSGERYIRKHFGALGWQSYRAANVFGAAVRAVVLRGERRTAAARRMSLFLRGPVAAARRAAD